jgi:hypothetical protein
MGDEILKGPSHVTDSRNSIELANTVAVSEKHGTHGDERDMERMGKIPELRVWSMNSPTSFRYTYKITSDNSSFCPSLASL